MGRSGIWIGIFLAAAPAASAQSFNYNGFNPSAGVQDNGTADFVVVGPATVARLTTKTGNQAGSVFTTAQYDITRFTSTFRIQFTDTTGGFADGICFVIQRVGPAALGGTGGSMGYATLLTSVAVKFDIHSQPNSSTGLYQNGAAPGTTPETVISPNINFGNQQVFEVDVDYDGTDLVVVIRDTSNNNTDTRTYPIDIPTVIGGTAAHVGFTGATGGQSAVQDVLSWSFATVYPVPAPTGVSAIDGLQNQIVITWNAVPNAVSYEVFSAPAAGGPWSSLATVNAPTTTYTHNTVGTYFYAVQATTALGTSGNSNVDEGTSYAPPRTNNHDEGLLNDSCSCGSSAGAGPGLAALAGLLLLGAFRRR